METVLIKHQLLILLFHQAPGNPQASLDFKMQTFKDQASFTS